MLTDTEKSLVSSGAGIAGTENHVTCNQQSNCQCKYSNEGVAKELATWREQLTIDRAKHLSNHSTQDKYSVAVLGCGGLLDTSQPSEQD